MLSVCEPDSEVLSPSLWIWTDVCACPTRRCFNPSGAGLQVSSSSSFLLRQSPRWRTNLQRLCASLLTSSFPFSFPFAVVCPEKEVEFQRAPNGEPCLPTRPPAPCCPRPPAGHANPRCNVRVLPSSSLHVRAVQAGVAVLPGGVRCPRSPGGLRTRHGEEWCGTPSCCAWAAPSSPRAGCESGRDSGPGGKHWGRPSLTQEERPWAQALFPTDRQPGGLRMGCGGAGWRL